MKPSKGRILLYRLTATDVETIKRRREVSQREVGVSEAHSFGNSVTVGEQFPMVVTEVWPNEHGPNFDGVNGQVLLDGNDSLWVTSAKEGTEAGTWSWPPRVEEAKKAKPGPEEKAETQAMPPAGS